MLVDLANMSENEIQYYLIAKNVLAVAQYGGEFNL